jgi:hypothetical protein
MRQGKNFDKIIKLIADFLGRVGLMSLELLWSKVKWHFQEGWTWLSQFLWNHPFYLVAALVVIIIAMALLRPHIREK